MTSRLLINEPPILVFPSLAAEVGANEAMVLQQIHYWLTSKGHKHNFDGDVWVRNTYDQWGKQFPFMANKTLRRAISSLEELELIQSFVAHEASRKTKFYTIQYNNVDKLGLPSRTYIRASKPTVPSVSGLRRSQTYHADFDREITDPVLSGCASGQSDQIDLPNLDYNSNLDEISGSSCGHFDQTNLVKMTRSYTEEETTFRDIIIPPPNPPQATSSKNLSDFDQIDEKSISRKSGQYSREPGIPSQLKPSEDEDEDLSSRMIKVWNRLVQGQIKDAPRKELVLTDSRRQALGVIFNGILDGDFAEWERYCARIAGTQFLLGENASGFKVSLEWALSVPNALKVLEGRIYDKPVAKTAKPEISQGEFSLDLKEHFRANGYPAEWLAVYQGFVALNGQAPFNVWLKPCVPLARADGQAVLIAPTRFHRDHMTTNYLCDLKNVARSCWKDETNINIEVRG